MKKILLFIFCISISTFSFSQKDSTRIYPKYLLCLCLHAGMQQQNFSSLHQIPYLLNQPPNISIQQEAGLLFGKRGKYLISAYLGISDIFVFSLNKQITGNYNDYTVKTSSEYFHYGSSFYYNVFHKYNNKLIREIYPSIGIQFAQTSINSKATGRGISNADTSFYYEQSRALSPLINFGVLIEFMKLKKRKTDFSEIMPLSISAGYTLQIQNPTWRYLTPNNDPRKVNQGGFYFMVGYELWWRKGWGKNH